MVNSYAPEYPPRIAIVVDNSARAETWNQVRRSEGDEACRLGPAYLAASTTYYDTVVSSRDKPPRKAEIYRVLMAVDPLVDKSRPDRKSLHVGKTGER